MSYLDSPTMWRWIHPRSNTWPTRQVLPHSLLLLVKGNFYVRQSTYSLGCNFCFATACEEHVLPNTDIPGNDFTKIFATCHQHCLALCSAHPRCSLFSFDRLVRFNGPKSPGVSPYPQWNLFHSWRDYCVTCSRDNGCYLKHIKESQKVEFKDKHKVTSGFPARFCKMDSCT